ncbi:hypothetical protein HQ560_02195, partial [bacterium]|nr:hypothetical protein [bacterium]
MAHDIAPRTLGLLLSLCWIAPCLGAATMVDPVIDDETREWCYLAKSTTVIGVPYMPDAVQVTFDGAIYT